MPPPSLAQRRCCWNGMMATSPSSSPPSPASTRRMIERTHADIRELKVDYISGPWSATFGVDTVFWGKTEAVHLVDIINQTDQVEDLDDEDRLGQPLVRVAYLADAGEFSAFILPYFRERTFPGEDGRLRTSLPIDTDRAIYDTSAEEWTPAAALRFAGVFGDVDFGVSGFYGLGRDPAFVFQGVRCARSMN